MARKNSWRAKKKIYFFFIKILFFLEKSKNVIFFLKIQKCHFAPKNPKILFFPVNTQNVKSFLNIAKNDPYTYSIYR